MDSRKTPPAENISRKTGEGLLSKIRKIDEPSLLREFNKNEWKSSGKKAIKKYSSLAKKQLKQARLNIRLSEEVLNKIKSDAAEMGIPYQTLIASVLHRYAHGSLQDEKHILKAIETLKKAT